MSKKKRVDLEDHEAKALGFSKLNKASKGRRLPRYMLDQKQLETLAKIRAGIENDTSTTSNEYFGDAPVKVLSAWNSETGTFMDIDTYAAHYGMPRDEMKSWKLVSHTGTPYYNIVFHDMQDKANDLDIEELRHLVKKGLDGIGRTNKTPKIVESPRIGLPKVADLHLGAYVDNLIRTKDFSINILANRLRKAAGYINNQKYDIVHVHILGDLIESFTGLNHKNSWKGLDKTMVGAEVIKLAVKILHKDFLDLINNLEEVKIVAGNHDRVTSSKEEDSNGDAANLIAWGLEMMGYSVEFNSLVISHKVQGVMHILQHGDKGSSKKDVADICWDYGEQGCFNLITFGHLHSTIEKLSVSQRDKFDVVKFDSVDKRVMYCPSFFTGNGYSEDLGYTTSPGMIVAEDNGEGVPHVFNFAL